MTGVRGIRSTFTGYSTNQLYDFPSMETILSYDSLSPSHSIRQTLGTHTIQTWGSYATQYKFSGLFSPPSSCSDNNFLTLSLFLFSSLLNRIVMREGLNFEPCWRSLSERKFFATPHQVPTHMTQKTGYFHYSLLPFSGQPNFLLQLSTSARHTQRGGSRVRSVFWPNHSVL